LLDTSDAVAATVDDAWLWPGGLVDVELARLGGVVVDVALA